MKDLDMNQFLIRSASKDDIADIVRFNRSLALETEERHLESDVIERGVRRGFDFFPAVRYFVAETDGQIIGQVMLTREWSDWRDGWIWWLQSVYVEAPFRRRGVFHELLNHVVDLARANPDVVGIRLYVEQDNAVAQSVYQRSGFVDPHYRVMEKML